MSPYLRKVKTASGAIAVQIVEKTAGVRRIVEHLGSAHDEAELAALMTAGREKLTAPDQAMLDFGGPTVMQPAVVTGSRSAVLVEAIQTAWSALGFDQLKPPGLAELVALTPGGTAIAPADAAVNADRVVTLMDVDRVLSGEDVAAVGAVVAE